MNKDIEKAIEDSIMTNELSDLSKELGEIALDSILTNGILKDIPFISSINALVKTGFNIRETIFTKKILRFLLELNEVSQKERIEFINNIENDAQLESKVGESIIMIIDKIDSMQKPKLLGRLLAASMQKKITYNQFLKLSAIINRAFVPTLYKLLDINRDIRVDDNVYEELFNLNLVTLKLINDENSRLSAMSIGRKGLPHRGEQTEIFNQRLNFEISTDGKMLIDTILSKI